MFGVVLQAPHGAVRIGYPHQVASAVVHETRHSAGGVFDLRYNGTAGLQDFTARYEIPVTPWDTTFGLHGRGAWSKVREDPFDALDVESESQTIGFTLRQPLYRTSSGRCSNYSGFIEPLENYLANHA